MVLARDSVPVICCTLSSVTPTISDRDNPGTDPLLRTVEINPHVARGYALFAPPAQPSKGIRDDLVFRDVVVNATSLPAARAFALNAAPIGSARERQDDKGNQ